MIKNIYLSIIISLFLVTFIPYGSQLNANDTLPNYENVIIVAHRGASAYAPENTMAAFEKAVEMGADFLELDVHLSKDNILVVIHDESLERTVGKSGYIRDYTLADLRMLDAGTFFDQTFSNEPIPTLEEVLATYYGKINLMIEIKKPHLYPGIKEELTKVLAPYVNDELVDSIMIQSFDLKFLKELHEILPEFPKGAIISKKYTVFKYKQLKEISSFATFVNYKSKHLNKNVVAKIHSLDMLAYSWTVNNPKEANRLIHIGVDGIVTDMPDLLAVK